MSIMDEIPPRLQEANFSRINHQAHMDIDQQISDFIAMGGAITPVPSGYSGDPEANRFIRNEFDPTKLRESKERREKGKIGAAVQKRKTEPFYDSVNRAKKRSKWGQGISTSGKYFTYTLSGVRYGVGEKLGHEQCLELRKKVRERMGLPPAEY